MGHDSDDRTTLLALVSGNIHAMDLSDRALPSTTRGVSKPIFPVPGSSQTPLLTYSRRGCDFAAKIYLISAHHLLALARG